MRILNFKMGAIVVVQNSINRGFFYVVKNGTLTVDSEHSFTDKVLSRFEEGDSFGLVSALTGHKFLVTVTAATDAVVIEVPINMLGSFFEKQPKVAFKMLSLLSRELKATHKYLAMVNLPADRQSHPRKLLKDAQDYLALERPKYASYALNKFISWAGSENNMAEEMEKAASLLKATAINYPVPSWQALGLKLAPDEIIFLENEPSKEIYVIKSGTVRLFKLARGQELIIDVIGPGEIFGELAFIDDSYRMASAVTDTESILMRFSKDNLFNSMGAGILQKIFESMARRIWFCHQRLVILRIANPVTRLYAFIYNLIRDFEIKNKVHKGKIEQFEFNLNLTELKKMCGLMKINNDKIQEFLKDHNLIINDKSLKVINRKRIEEKVAFYKTQSGQIATVRKENGRIS